jgi:cytochrome P450 family 142 subfamily A polypeptide 1
MTDTTEATVGTADLLSPSWWADVDGMHEFFTWARREAPVYRDDANGLWAVTRHADIIDVERRSGVFSSRGCYRANINLDETDTIALDDPEHQAQRRLVSRRFTPKAVHAHDELLQGLIDELVDAASERGELEVVGDLAAQLPSRLTARLLGYPEDAWPELKVWSEKLVRTDMVFRDADTIAGMMEAIVGFNTQLVQLAEARRGRPADDLITEWVGAGMDPMTMMHETGLFIAGGAETTRTAIGRGLAVLAEHPEQWEAAAADPSLLPGLVEEVIRWVTPLNNMFRSAAVDDHIGAQPVSAGDRVMLAYPSANRDEAVFEDPFRFDIRRDPNPHVAFGQGTHFCVGANLARLELRMLFGTLVSRWKDLVVLEPPDVEPNIFAGAVRSFRLGFTNR